MPRTTLYIATSLDGYIADREGGIDWLPEIAPMDKGEDYGYKTFYASIDALAMGRKTYEQVLGFGQWPYIRKPTYVFSTRAPQREDTHVTFVSEAPEAFLAQRFDEAEHLWLVGGAGLIASFRAAGLIDAYIISVMPILLGEGIPLFTAAQPKAPLELREARSFESGVVQLRYVTPE